MEIKFTVAKNGQKRAYYLSRQQYRWFPLPVAEAEAKLAKGEAFLVQERQTVAIPKNPTPLDEKGKVIDFFDLFQGGGNC